MRLVFVRHGQTPANVLGQLDTAAPGPELTPLGRRQAEALAETLGDSPIDSISASTLLRTQRTAAPVAEALGLPVTIRPGIHEIVAGDLEKRSDRASVRSYLEIALGWAMGDLDTRMPGAFDGHEFFARVDADIAAIVESGISTGVVVSHGAAIRVWVGARAENIPPSFAAEHELRNTGIVVVEGDQATGWILDTWAGKPVTDLSVTGRSSAPDLDPTGETLHDAQTY